MTRHRLRHVTATRARAASPPQAPAYSLQPMGPSGGRRPPRFQPRRPIAPRPTLPAHDRGAGQLLWLSEKDGASYRRRSWACSWSRPCSGQRDGHCVGSRTPDGVRCPFWGLQTSMQIIHDSTRTNSACTSVASTVVVAHGRVKVAGPGEVQECALHFIILLFVNHI